MTDVQLFQLLGLTFFAMGIGMITTKDFFKGISKEFLASTVSVFYGGLVCMAIGYPLVAFHNIWESNISVVITLLGWLTLFKGFALLMFPRYMARFYKKMLTPKNSVAVSYGVLFFGIIFLYLGYFA